MAKLMGHKAKAESTDGGHGLVFHATPKLCQAMPVFFIRKGVYGEQIREKLNELRCLVDT